MKRMLLPIAIVASVFAAACNALPTQSDEPSARGLVSHVKQIAPRDSTSTVSTEGTTFPTATCQTGGAGSGIGYSC